MEGASHSKRLILTHITVCRSFDSGGQVTQVSSVWRLFGESSPSGQRRSDPVWGTPHSSGPAAP